MEIPDKMLFKSNVWPKQIYVYLLLVLFISACALEVRLVGQYDEVLDESIRDIHTQTSSFFIALKKDIGTPEADYMNYSSFYEEVEGELSFLILRSEILEEEAKVKTLTTLLGDLKLQYEDLESMHQKNLINNKVLESSKNAFDRSFRAIIAYMVNLKQHNKLPK